jgi:hypothetical protein
MAGSDTGPALDRFAIDFDHREWARVHALWETIFDSGR